MADASESAERFSVLLVDDDHDVLGANARFLRLNQVAVHLAADGDSALRRLMDTSIDVIVTDLCMPGIDGIEFARRARHVRPLTPIVFFSGFATVPDVVRAMQLGAVDFLEKPIEPEHLLSSLLELRDRYETSAIADGSAFDLQQESPSFRDRVLAYERFLIESSLRKYNGRVSAVIDALRINRRTLNDKMRRLGIQRDLLD